MMNPVLASLLALISTWLRSRRSMQREIVALRHQLGVYQRARCRPRINPADRLLWSWISRHWPGWRDFLVFVQPRTVTAWQQARFRDHWRRLSQGGEPGRPPISSEIRAVLLAMATSTTFVGRRARGWSLQPGRVPGLAPGRIVSIVGNTGRQPSMAQPMSGLKPWVGSERVWTSCMP